MENLSPSLILLWEVKRALEKGQSISSGIKQYLRRQSIDPFHQQVQCWWLSKSHPTTAFSAQKLSVTRKNLLEILDLGLRGQSILETLKSYETELIQSCDDEIQKHVSLLPLLLMLPLMCLIFPALMLLLVGPLLKTFQF